MTGVPPPPISMCQRSFAPPSSHLSGRPVSVDVPFCAGPRQLSQPLARRPPAAEALSPRPVSSRPAAATAGKTRISVIPFPRRGARPALFDFHVQADQVALVAAAIDPAVGEDRVAPPSAARPLAPARLAVPVGARLRQDRLPPLVRPVRLPARANYPALAMPRSCHRSAPVFASIHFSVFSSS